MDWIDWCHNVAKEQDYRVVEVRLNDGRILTGLLTYLKPRAEFRIYNPGTGKWTDFKGEEVLYGVDLGEYKPTNNTPTKE
jgi:hypothetical protein